MILDAGCGARHMYSGWDKKLDGDIIGIDIRQGDFSYSAAYNFDDKSKARQWGTSKVLIKPHIQADMKFLPFRDNVFDAVLFDPPHTNAGLGSWVWKRYGGWSQSEVIQTARAINDEFARVLKANGFIVMKTYLRTFPLYETLLRNFRFFLPIERRTGTFKKKAVRKILWTFGQLKPMEKLNIIT